MIPATDETTANSNLFSAEDCYSIAVIEGSESRDDVFSLKNFRTYHELFTLLCISWRKFSLK